MITVRVITMWYRILRKHGFSRSQAWFMARRMVVPTKKAIDEHGGVE